MWRDEELRQRNARLVARLAAVSDGEREALIEQLTLVNLPVAGAIARRYAGRSNAGPDLEQVACVALVRAARDFDPGRGEFLAYAIPCMTGAVKRYFRDSAWTIRPPRRVQADHADACGRADHVEDGVHVESCFHPISLDAPRPGQASPIGEGLALDDDRTWERAETRLLLWPELRALPERAQRVLHLRFVEDRTQQEIADELGMTQYHVSRLLRRHLSELRERMVGAA